MGSNIRLPRLGAAGARSRVRCNSRSPIPTPSSRTSISVKAASCAELMGGAFETVLRRDRAVVIAALAILTALAWMDLAWLADDMAMGGMDTSGFRMIPAGQGLMMPAGAPWQPIEFAFVL